LENGADPNLLEHAADRGWGQPSIDGLKILLHYGADPNIPSSWKGWEGRKKQRDWEKFQQWLRSYYNMNWEEFVKRAKAGESLERLRERQRRE